MNDNLKKGLLILVIVLAVAFAGWQVTKFVGSETPHAEGPAIQSPPGHKSEKQLALEAQGQGGNSVKNSSDSKSQEEKESALAGN